jgi:ubiquinone biosynthesis protein UbiJ
LTTSRSAIAKESPSTLPFGKTDATESALDNCQEAAYTDLMITKETGMTDATTQTADLIAEINRLRARVQVLEREVERLEQKSEKDWKWFSDATGM